MLCNFLLEGGDYKNEKMLMDIVLPVILFEINLVY